VVDVSLGEYGGASADERQARLSVALQREHARRGGAWATGLRTFIYPSLTLVGLLVVWQVATVVLAIPGYLLPAPSDILGEIVDRRATLLRHALVTFWEIVAGFGLSILIGAPVAVLIAYSRTFERTIYPLLVSSQTIPKVAIAPLFIVWFGFGFAPKVVVAFLIAVFPIVIDSVVGLKATPPEMLHLVRSMGASAWQSFWVIRVPNALPSFFGGLKVAITLAVVGAIVGEFVGADQGLGYLIQVSNGNLDTLLLFAAMAVLALLGIALFIAVDLAERLLLPWHISARADDR
jgi:NitT/TauT family transport system permease protein